MQLVRIQQISTKSKKLVEIKPLAIVDPDKAIRHRK